MIPFHHPGASWWGGPDSNRQRRGLRPRALPLELPPHALFSWRGVRDSNPWSSDRQSDVLTGLHQRPAWYPQEDSNLQPSGPQPDALSFELRGYVRIFRFQRAARVLVPGGRFELPRVLPHQPLRLARLPVPPSRRMLMVGAGGLEPPQSEDVAFTARWNCRYPMPPLVLLWCAGEESNLHGIAPTWF